MGVRKQSVGGHAPPPPPPPEQRHRLLVVTQEIRGNDSLFFLSRHSEPGYFLLLKEQTNC